MRYNYIKNILEETEINAEKLAVCGTDKDITWAELKLITEKVREIVQQLNIPEGHPVIIYGHKEALFPSLILSLMLCNIPYIPVDKIYPDERLNKVKNISKSQVIFNCGDYQFDVDFPVVVDKNFNININQQPDFVNKTYGSTEDPLRYIIFTSGSTGEPKGVQITQQALCSFIDWIDKDFGFDSNDVYINLAPFSFDLSVYELTCYLHFGGTLLLTDSETVADLDNYFGRIKRYNATVWVSTPSFAYLCIREEKFNNKNIPYIKTFLFCGETLPNNTSQKLLENFPSSRVFNTYGPTEATVATTLIDITKEIADKYDILPVGFVKYTSEIVIDKVDEEQTGEIIIAGDNVSIGYLGNDELTNEKFFDYKGRRAYRTGDVGYIKDNMLFYLGRNDDQVKLHGFRIELGEISSNICKFDFVDDAATIPLKRNNEVVRIVTFVIKNKLSTFDHIQIKEKIINELSEKLPYYMIPSDIRIIDKFPFSTNHKIDKNKLTEIYKQGVKT